MKHIKLWGTGKALRELIYCDDIADACLYFLNKKTKHSLINIGTGIEYSINRYAKIIMRHMDVDFKINYEKKYLDGTKRKLLDNSLAKSYGWSFKTTLDRGLKKTIQDYLSKNL